MAGSGVVTPNSLRQGNRWGRVSRGLACGPGVDATFTGSERQLEYTLTVAPRANPRQIALG